MVPCHHSHGASWDWAINELTIARAESEIVKFYLPSIVNWVKTPDTVAIGNWQTNLNFIFGFLTFDLIPESQSLVNPSQGEESSWRRARLCRRRRSGRGSGRAPPSRTLARWRAARIGTSICSPWWVAMPVLVQGEGRVESCRGQWRWKWGRDPLAGERNLPGNDNTGHGMALMICVDTR